MYGNYIDEPLERVHPMGYITGYYVHDHLYSTAAFLNSAGTVWQRYEYDAYGRREHTQVEGIPRPSF